MSVSCCSYLPVRMLVRMLVHCGVCAGGGRQQLRGDIEVDMSAWRVCSLFWSGGRPRRKLCSGALAWYGVWVVCGVSRACTVGGCGLDEVMSGLTCQQCQHGGCVPWSGQMTAVGFGMAGGIGWSGLTFRGGLLLSNPSAIPRDRIALGWKFGLHR